MTGIIPTSRKKGRTRRKIPLLAWSFERPAKTIKQNIAAKIPRGRKVKRPDLALRAAPARSRFQPQRAQKGLLPMLKARRNETGEPQRGQVMAGMNSF